MFKIQIDSNRDGQLGPVDVAGRNWRWGAGEPGAVLVANNDRERGEHLPSASGASELAPLYIEYQGPLENGVHSVHLMATGNSAHRFTVYRVDQEERLQRVLGADPAGKAPPTVLSEPLGTEGESLLVEAREIPGPGFEGLITLEAVVLDSATQRVLDIDYVVFRVAPWIMTPNTQAPVRVFAVELTDRAGETTNGAFLQGLSSACQEAQVPLTVIKGADYSPGRQDRWIQDEIEFGYCQGATHTIPVVFDSPRDRGLDDFPERELLGVDFGHFGVTGYNVNSLDSFGNLEVSPPVTVDGRHYPFGRIVFGGKAFTDYGPQSRQMMPTLRRFLYAQKVQSPIEVFSDWLHVGHIDEFMNFIPDETSEKGFKLLLASPRLCLERLRALKQEGYGGAVMFQGMWRDERIQGHGWVSAEITVERLLEDELTVSFNDACQKDIEINRKILSRELGLSEGDIIEAPVLFREYYGRALAYFPDMVNHLVLGAFSLVPKPHGPRVNGTDVFEEMMMRALPQGREVRFIEDWYGYHEASGEVHCGTNTLREPFATPWWNYRPEGGFDI